MNANTQRAARAALPPARAQTKKKPKKKVAVAKAKKIFPMRTIRGGELGEYLNALDNPFDCLGAKCPINYNPAPSFIQTSNRTTVTRSSFAVATSTTQTVVLYPGHMEQVQAADSATSLHGIMDPTAYHSGAFRMSGDAATSTKIIGPLAGSYTNVTSTSTTPGIGYTLPGSGNNYNIELSTPGGTFLTYDAPLPYSYNGTTGHVRWQLVSMGLRMRNVTPVLNRGGAVFSVVPNSDFLATGGTVTSLAIFPTFRDHGDCSDGMYVKWVPRGGDLAFWHDACLVPANTPIFSTLHAANPGLVAVMVNGTATTQLYDIEIVCNWQLAGSLINVIGGPAPHQPALKSIVEPVISQALAHPNVSSSTPPNRLSNNMQKLGSIVMNHDPSAAGPSLGEKLANHAIDIGVGALKRAAGFQ